MQIDCAIIDDKVVNRLVIRRYLQLYYPMLNIQNEGSSLEEAKSILFNLSNGIAFLDIQLDSDRLIFDLLREMTVIPFQIIFISSFDKFSLPSHKFFPVGFIQQPIQLNIFKENVDKAIERHLSGSILSSNVLNDSLSRLTNKADLISIVGVSKIDVIHVDKILYLKSDGKYTSFYVEGSNKEIVSSKNIGEYEKMLSTMFVRVHNSYVVNLNHLLKIEKDYGHFCILSDQSRVPISKRRYKDLFNRLLH